MAAVEPPNEAPLTIAMNLVTALIGEYEIAEINANPEPINCVALLDMIEAAQRLYTKFCPIAAKK